MPSYSNVEQRVVEMRIDNKKFESGAKQTISTLEKLEKALHFKSDTSSIDNIANSVSKFDASPMANSIEKVQATFSALEIAGLRVIQNLTDSIYNFATRTIKSLSIDQVTEGWNKYEKMIEATQVIMAATRDQIGASGDKIIDGGIYKTVTDELGATRDVLVGFVDEAGQMDVINAQLEKLLWYTDETSYNFTDMADNVGKFLAAGVGLEDAFTAMMGIASWGASAGAKPAEVSRAMYNISQAMGQGAMQLMDWKSIENANMATLDFKRNVLQIAKEMGYLKEITNDVDAGFTTITDPDRFDENGYIMEMSEKEADSIINALNFREGLKDKWFNKDVMTEVFRRYGLFADELRKYTEETGMEATPILEVLSKFREAEQAGGFDWEAYGQSADLTADELEKLRKAVIELDKLNVDYGYSEQGFRMGQEAKTFTDAIEATKDAVSSGWMKTFQLIFGDYLQAKTFWTDVTAELWEIFASGGLRRNEILKAWNENGGRTFLLGKWTEEIDGETVEFQGALWNLLDAIRSVTTPIHEAFSEVFGLDDTESLGKRLAEITKRFQEFTAELGFSEEAGKGIKNIFKVFFSILKTGLTIAKGAISVFIGVAEAFGSILDAAGKLFAGDIDLDTFFDIVTKKIKDLIPTTEDVKNAFLNFFKNIKNFAPTEEQILSFFESMKKLGKRGWNWMKDFFTIDNLKSMVPSLDRIRDIYHKITGYLWTNYPTLTKWLYDLKEMANLSTAFEGLKSFFSKIGTWLGSVNINIDSFRDSFSTVGNFFKSIISALFGDPEKLKENVKAIVGTIFATLKEEISKITLADIFRGAKLVGLTVFLGQLAGIVRSFRNLTDSVQTIPDKIGDVLDSFKRRTDADTYIKIAVAIGILAASLVALAQIKDTEKLTHVATILALLLGALALVAKRMSSVKNIFGSGGINVQVFSKLATTLIGLGFVLTSITLAVAALAFIPKENLKNASDTILKLMALMAVITILFTLTDNVFGSVKSSSGAAIKAAASMAIMALAINMLVLPLAAISGLLALGADVEEAFSFLKALVVLFGLLAVVLALVSGKTGNGALKGAAAFALVAFSINLLLPALMALTATLSVFASKIPWDKISEKTNTLTSNLWKFAGLIVALLAIGAAMYFIGKGVMYFGVGALAAGAGALLFVAALYALAKVTDTVVEALPKIANGLIEFGKIVKSNKRDLLAAAVPFAILAASIIGLALVFNKFFGNKKMGSLIGGFTGAIVSGIGRLVKSLGTAVTNSIPSILNIFGSLLILVGLHFVGILPQLTEILVTGVISLFTSLSNSMEQHKPELVESITKIVKTIIGVFSDVLSGIFNKEFWNDLDIFGKIILGIGSVEMGMSILNNLVKPFKTFGRTIGDGKGGGLIGKVSKLKDVIVNLIDSAGGLSAVGGPIAILLASMGYAWNESNKQQEQFQSEAFAGLEKDVNGYVEAIYRAKEAVAETQQDLDNLALSDDGSASTMYNQELTARTIALNDIYKEFAETLGITKDELLAQIEATGGNIEQIEAIQVYLENLKKSEEEAANSASTTTSMQADAYANLKSQIETLTGSMTGTVYDSADEVKAAGTEVGESGAREFVTSFISGLDDGQLQTLLSDAGANSMLQTFLGTEKSTDENAAPAAEYTIVGLYNELMNGDLLNKIYNAGGTAGNTYYSGYADSMNQHSPSRRMAEAGRFSILGLIQGLTKNAESVYDEGYGIGDKFSKAVQTSMAQVGILAGDDFSISPTITPVVDMSYVDGAAGRMDSMFGSTYHSYINGAGLKLGNLGDIGNVTATVESGINGGHETLDELRGLASRVDMLGEKIANMQIVLDTGILVGNTSAKMDKQLGRMAAHKGRAN